MLGHSTHTPLLLSFLLAVFIFSLSLAGIAGAQGNTTFGADALQNNTTGSFNTGLGFQALFSNTTWIGNNAYGDSSLFFTTTGNNNTAMGDSGLFGNITGNFRRWSCESRIRSR